MTPQKQTAKSIHSRPQYGDSSAHQNVSLNAPLIHVELIGVGNETCYWCISEKDVLRNFIN